MTSFTLDTTHFLFEKDHPLDIILKECYIVLFYNNETSHDILDIWNNVSHQIIYPYFGLVNVIDVSELSSIFNDDSLPCVIVYKEGSPIIIYDDVFTQEEITDYALTLACNSSENMILDFQSSDQLVSNFDNSKIVYTKDFYDLNNKSITITTAISS